MLVIFDLDDTLVETSKCLTPYYLEQAYLAMQNSGLPPKENPFTKFLECNASALTSKKAIQEFCKHLPSNIEEAGLAALTLEIPAFLPLEPVPGALSLLDLLQTRHILALVTLGDPTAQRIKLKKAGIQPERFSKLVVGKGPSKKKEYQDAMEAFGVHPSEVLVCGDRVSIDLSPAKELGFFTVHLRNGRGKVHNEPQCDVDLTIDTLQELAHFEALHEVQ